MLPSSKCCRICFEKEFEGSRLIAPCKCRGSSQYIHIHCLQQWQETAIESNSPHKAIFCPVCLSEYTYPSKLFLIYRRLNHHMKTWWAILSILFFTLAITPIKLFLHALLVIVTVPFGQISLGNMALAWIGCDFPPQLALIRNGRGLSIPSLRRGMLLVANQNIPNSSLFHRAVILILEHSKIAGSRGVIINMDRDDVPNSAVSDVCIGNGGPMEHDVFTVLHDCLDSKQFSKSISSEERIYVAENENAFQTVQFMLRMKMFTNNNRFSSTAAEEGVSPNYHSLSTDSTLGFQSAAVAEEEDDSRWETESLDTIVSSASSAVEGRNQYVRAFTSLLSRFSQRLQFSLESSRRQLTQHTSTVISQATRRLDAFRPATLRFRPGSFPLALIPENQELVNNDSQRDAAGGRNNFQSRAVEGSNHDRHLNSATNNVSYLFSSVTNDHSLSITSPSRQTLRNPNYRSISVEEREREQESSPHVRRHTPFEMIQSIHYAERFTPSPYPTDDPHSPIITNSADAENRNPSSIPQDTTQERPINVRFVRGNCLWLPGQLAGEVWARDWHLLSPKHEHVFISTLLQKQELWSQLINEAESFSDSILPPRDAATVGSFPLPAFGQAIRHTSLSTIATE